MRFTQDTGGGNIIQSYSERGIVINDRLIVSSVLVTASEIATWQPGAVAELEERHIETLLAYRPDIIVLGTGTTLTFPPVPLLAGIQRHGVGIEVMANDAAIRTFNVLLSEDRPALLALLQNGVSVD
jgi:uncharacterized protein